MPDVTFLEPMFGLIGMTLLLRQSFPAFVWQVVPENMPPGQYTFVLNAGYLFPRISQPTRFHIWQAVHLGARLSVTNAAR